MSTALSSAASDSTTNTGDRAKMKLIKSYQADQQLKYLHLQAEVEFLLQQLQKLKQNKISH